MTCIRVVLVVAGLVLALLLTFALTDCGALCTGRCGGLSLLAACAGVLLGGAVGFGVGANYVTET